jgi:hypothetical protein
VPISDLSPIGDTDDASFIRFESNGTEKIIRLKSGTRIYFYGPNGYPYLASRIVDANGNKITYSRS